MSVHVYPRAEEEMHRLGCPVGECDCDPIVEWIDPDTGLPYDDGPLVIHQCFTKEAYDECGRELEAEREAL